MSERKKLEQAINKLEGQRVLLGDEAVEASIAALTKELAALEPSLPEERVTRSLTNEECQQFLHMDDCPETP